MILDEIIKLIADFKRKNQYVLRHKLCPFQIDLAGNCHYCNLIFPEIYEWSPKLSHDKRPCPCLALGITPVRRIINEFYVNWEEFGEEDKF